MNLRHDMADFTYRLAAHGNSGYQRPDLHEYAKNHFPRGLRLAAYCLLVTPSISVPVSRRVVTRSYRGTDESVLGLGYHSVVMLDPAKESVRKYEHRTAVEHDEEKRKIVDERTIKQELLAGLFPDETVFQEYSIEPFPPNPDQTVVCATQPYVEGNPVDIEAPASPEVHSFLDHAKKTYQSTGIMPDFIGRGNLLSTENGLRLIDPIPLSGLRIQDRRTIQLSLIALRTHGIN